ncbi:hypothetical protein ACTP13_06990 [Paenibacillus peoriae]|uniref:hypothetical protein n=1 Tax=Paenibacillus peoriae TaxID=59893 RepID=UPI003F9477DB
MIKEMSSDQLEPVEWKYENLTSVRAARITAIRQLLKADVDDQTAQPVMTDAISRTLGEFGIKETECNSYEPLLLSINSLLTVKVDIQRPKHSSHPDCNSLLRDDELNSIKEIAIPKRLAIFFYI